MSSDELLESIVARIIKKYLPPEISYEATVISVDKDQDTCVVQADDADQMEDVRLKSVVTDTQQKLVVYPKVGSMVTVSCRHNMPNELFVSQWSEVDSIAAVGIKFNDGDKGGLVNWTDAKQQLDMVKQFIQSVKQTCSIPVNEAGNGSPSAFQAALNTALGEIQTPDFENLEDTQITH